MAGAVESRRQPPGGRLTLAARLLLVGVLGLLVVCLSACLRRFRAGGEADLARLPALGSDVTAGATRTWVVLSTPYCAACQPLATRLRSLDPTSRVVEVSVADRPDLASAYRIRTAPTLLLARRDGRVESLLAGRAIDEALARLRGCPPQRVTEGLLSGETSPKEPPAG